MAMLMKKTLCKSKLAVACFFPPRPVSRYPMGTGGCSPESSTLLSDSDPAARHGMQRTNRSAAFNQGTISRLTPPYAGNLLRHAINR